MLNDFVMLSLSYPIKLPNQDWNGWDDWEAYCLDAPNELPTGETGGWYVYRDDDAVNDMLVKVNKVCWNCGQHFATKFDWVSQSKFYDLCDHGEDIAYIDQENDQCIVDDQSSTCRKCKDC